MAMIPESIGNRTVLFSCLTGSYNYNLNTPTSDKDYHIFVCPAFDDLYYGTMLTKQYITDEEDLMVYDVRRMPELLWKSNPSFIEVLYTKELVVEDRITDDDRLDESVKHGIRELIAHRDEFARMNLPYLWDACIGIFLNKTKNYIKGTSGTSGLVRKYGYDTKQVMHAIRGLWILQRYAENGFGSFGDAIWFEGEDREYLLSIKEGRYTIDQAADAMDRKLREVERYKPLYKEQKTNEDSRELLDSIVRNLVADMTLNELSKDRRASSSPIQCEVLP